MFISAADHYKASTSKFKIIFALKLSKKKIIARYRRCYTVQHSAICNATLGEDALQVAGGVLLWNLDLKLLQSLRKV